MSKLNFNLFTWIVELLISRKLYEFSGHGYDIEGMFTTAYTKNGTVLVDMLLLMNLEAARLSYPAQEGDCIQIAAENTMWTSHKAGVKGFIISSIIIIILRTKNDWYKPQRKLNLFYSRNLIVVLFLGNFTPRTVTNCLKFVPTWVDTEVWLSFFFLFRISHCVQENLYRGG